MRTKFKVGKLVASSNPLKNIQAKRLEIEVRYKIGFPNQILKTVIR